MVAPAVSRLAAADRRKVLLASVVVPAAFLAAGGGSHHIVANDAEPKVDEPPPLAVEVVAAPAALASTPAVDHASAGPAPSQVIAASRYRFIDRSLPPGMAPERGLQVRTILASRAISAAFPQIHSIGGVRPDALRWHPNGLALDVMVPNASSSAGIALGNEIVSYALSNAKRFGLQDCIWRGVYYTPGGAQAGGYGHYDHVHITTTGGGFPSGDEIYFR